MAEVVPTNNQRGRRSGPCRLWGGLDKARHIVPTALLVRVQCFRKSLHKAVQGPSTRPIVVSMINGLYCRRRRCLTIFEPEKKYGWKIAKSTLSIKITNQPISSWYEYVLSWIQCFSWFCDSCSFTIIRVNYLLMIQYSDIKRSSHGVMYLF